VGKAPSSTLYLKEGAGAAVKEDSQKKPKVLRGEDRNDWEFGWGGRSDA